MFHEEFLAFLDALNQAAVKYILVGEYSVILHGDSRSTGDMDLWVKPDNENYARLKQAFNLFQMPVFDMTEDKFLDTNYDVFTFGRPPLSIDIMTSVKGLYFEETYINSEIHTFENIPIRVIHLNHLRKAKEASNRPKDQDDLLNLPDLTL
ncbi:MAG: hypothetical protein IPI60_20180 [Saprospiraceae bacterium]|nr:hypothetical protein [Saprospiraceae bacterium]